MEGTQEAKVISILSEKIIIHWTESEQKKFTQALIIYGKDWVKVSDFIGSRTNK